MTPSSPNRQSKLVERLRARLHARYTRAVVGSLALAVFLCSCGMAVIEVSHDVSSTAVVRFFSRSHFREPDLSRLIYNPATLARLEALFDRYGALDSGGLVYASDETLSFYPHPTARSESAQRQHRENIEIYPRLVKHYFAADLESLVREMQVPGVRARIEREHGDSVAMLGPEARSLDTLGAGERRRLLRRTRRYINAFDPLHRQPYELSFGEKLRFYEREGPRGQFVGIFQTRNGGWEYPFDDSHALATSSNNHYLTLTRGPGGRFVVRDYYQGARREHTVHLPPKPPGRLSLHGAGIG